MKMTVTFSMDNDAFAESGADEAARVLREAAEELTNYGQLDTGKLIRLYDINGNRIGYLTVED